MSGHAPIMKVEAYGKYGAKVLVEVNIVDRRTFSLTSKMQAVEYFSMIFEFYYLEGTHR